MRWSMTLFSVEISSHIRLFALISLHAVNEPLWMTSEVSPGKIYLHNVDTFQFPCVSSKNLYVVSWDFITMRKLLLLYSRWKESSSLQSTQSVTIYDQEGLCPSDVLEPFKSLSSKFIFYTDLWVTSEFAFNTLRNIETAY